MYSKLIRRISCVVDIRNRGLQAKTIVGIYYEKELQKTGQTELKVEKLIKIKGDKFYVEWKDYIDLFNNWI